MVRLSLGIYNTRDDVDALVDMLERIVRRDYHGDYFRDAESGGYIPAGYDDAILDHFSLTAPVAGSLRPQWYESMRIVRSQ